MKELWIDGKVFKKSGEVIINWSVVTTINMQEKSF